MTAITSDSQSYNSFFFHFSFSQLELNLEVKSTAKNYYKNMKLTTHLNGGTTRE